MKEYTEEEKGYIWLDSFQIEDGEKRRLLSEAGSAARLAGNFRFFGKSLIKSCGESVYNNMCASLSDDGYRTKRCGKKRVLRWFYTEREIFPC